MDRLYASYDEEAMHLKTVVVDVYHFDPNSISVIFDEPRQRLYVTGKHLEQVDDHGYATRSFCRMFKTLEGSEIEQVSRILPENISVILNPARFMLIRATRTKNQSKISAANYISPENTNRLNDDLREKVMKKLYRTNSGLHSLMKVFAPNRSRSINQPGTSTDAQRSLSASAFDTAVPSTSSMGYVSASTGGYGQAVPSTSGFGQAVPSTSGFGQAVPSTSGYGQAVPSTSASSQPPSEHQDSSIKLDYSAQDKDLKRASNISPSADFPEHKKLKEYDD